VESVHALSAEKLAFVFSQARAVGNADPRTPARRTKLFADPAWDAPKWLPYVNDVNFNKSKHETTFFGHLRPGAVVNTTLLS